MDVEYAVGKAIDEARSEYPHEPGEDHALGAALFDGPGHGPREGRPIMVYFPANDLGVDPRGSGALQRPSVGVVGDHDPNVRIDARTIDQRLQVGARSRCQNCDVDLRPPKTGLGQCRSSPRDRVARLAVRFNP